MWPKLDTCPKRFSRIHNSTLTTWAHQACEDTNRTNKRNFLLTLYDGLLHVNTAVDNGTRHRRVFLLQKMARVLKWICWTRTCHHHRKAIYKAWASSTTWTLFIAYLHPQICLFLLLVTVTQLLLLVPLRTTVHRDFLLPSHRCCLIAIVRLHINFLLTILLTISP